MNHLKTRNKIRAAIIVFVMVVGFTHLVEQPAQSHGGKTHKGESFTAFQAVQKATKLYERLVASGKLSEVWETGLKTIKISIRNTQNMREYIVQFETDKEHPNSVYFFFNQDGGYSGSNFTGK